MKEWFNFYTGIVMSFVWWIFTPFQKVDFYVPAIAICLLFVAINYIISLRDKIDYLKNATSLQSKVVEMKDDLIIFKVNISEVFFIDGIVTVFKMNGQFEEVVAVAKIENIQKNNLVQVRVLYFINNKSIEDLQISNILFIKPGVNISWLKGVG